MLICIEYGDYANIVLLRGDPVRDGRIVGVPVHRGVLVPGEEWDSVLCEPAVVDWKPGSIRGRI